MSRNKENAMELLVTVWYAQWCLRGEKIEVYRGNIRI